MTSTSFLRHSTVQEPEAQSDRTIRTPDRSVLIHRVVAHAKLTAPDATPSEALGESIDLIVMTPGKSQLIGESSIKSVDEP